MKLKEYVILVLTTIFHCIVSNPDCPQYCTCKWKNGKQTIECIEKGLLEIPDNLDPATQVLDFSGNKIQVLENELFVKKRIVNLQRAYLSKCFISTIEERSFKDLTNLVELDLSENELETIPTSAFRDISSLMRLNMRRNPIKKLDKFAFNHLTYLNTLELSNCELDQVHGESFKGLYSLESLYLDGNHMRALNGERPFPDNLKNINLDNNPWECDCHLSDFYEWLVNFKMPSSIDPVCYGPLRLEGKSIKSVEKSDLACLPDISPTTFYLELSEGKNVSLICYVNAIPEAKVSWWFHGQMLQNNSVVAPGVHLIYFVEEGTENKKSELYLFNANINDNGTFICNAENSAGKSQANFTIRVILKKEPLVIIVSLSFEYLLAIIIAIAAVILLLVFIILILILKCSKKRKRKTEVHNSIQENPIKTIPDQAVISNMVSSTENITIHAPCEDRNPVYRQVSLNPIRSPSSLLRYQLEQNPDIINGVRLMAYRENGDGEDGHIRRFSGSDHGSLTSGRIPEGVSSCRFIDSDGYPADFGLPRISRRKSENFYRTLPHNRMKYHSASNPAARCSREAEFLSQSAQTATSYDHFHTDIRYTADGYPERIDKFDSLSSSPPDSFRSEPPIAPTKITEGCRGMIRVDNMHMIKQFGMNKRCASAQTDEVKDDQENDKGETSNFSTTNEGVHTLTASPDEGYGGEPSVV